MATKIIPKKSSVAAKVPLATDLDVGEIAINLTDQKLYSKTAAGAVVEIGATADQTITAGAGLTGGGTNNVTLSHADTSAQASVNNSGATVIQDVTLDTYGHVTGLASTTLSASTIGAVPLNVGTTWTSVGANALSFRSTDVLETATSDQAALGVYQDTAGADAFMQFHVAGDYAAYFGLKGDINDFAVGGWSMGGNYYRVWHAGNDGSGSGLDADLLDGVHGASFMRKDQSNTVTGSFAIAGSFGNIMSTDGYDAFLYSEGSQKLRTWNSGILVSGTATATDFNTTSDARLKDNVSTIDNALDKVLAMRGVEFDWKETGEHTVGFIAQEVEEVVPELVSTDEEGMKSVKYGNMTAVLLEAIKELQAEVAALKAQVNKQ